MGTSTGAELRARRHGAGLSIRQLAQRADVSPSTVWRIEAGRLDPTVGLLDRLHSVLRTAVLPTEATREQRVSLALGRLTASKILGDDEAAFERAKRHLRRLLEDEPSSASARWLHEWERLLDGPLEDVVVALLDPSERGYELRAHTPFAGLASDDERLSAIRRSSGRDLATRSA